MARSDPVSLLFIAPLSGFSQEDVVLLSDDFSSYRPGLFSSVVGAHTEYHYLPEAAAKGNGPFPRFDPASIRSVRGGLSSPATNRPWRRRIETSPSITIR